MRKESAQEDGELNDEEADESDTDRSGRLKPPRIVLLRKGKLIWLLLALFAWFPSTSIGL